MKLIHKFKSPNFDKRKSSKILFIIIHYTALKNYREAISYLSDPKNKVSSHYLISQTGAVFNLVSEKKSSLPNDDNNSQKKDDLDDEIPF